MSSPCAVAGAAFREQEGVSGMWLPFGTHSLG